MYKDPLLLYYHKIGIDLSIIQSIHIGAKYVAVRLTNGNIGVCATLNFPVDKNNFTLQKINLNKLSCRIIYNSYINAVVNYKYEYNTEEDIFDSIDFKKYSSITMIGYFESLVAKFKTKNIPLTIFDKVVVNPDISDIKKQNEALKEAKAVIITSTTIANNTFPEIINAIKSNTDIFLLGPSTILDKEMLQYYNIRTLFGSVFSPNDKRVIDCIEQDMGTKSFMKYMKKVFLV